ncbi:MAG: hypothetical protein LBT36_05655 [Oscillospiraceae bacterium]|nr:hypothetical protein [Oscillospiraceae bacterium]
MPFFKISIQKERPGTAEACCREDISDDVGTFDDKKVNFLELIGRTLDVCLVVLYLANLILVVNRLIKVLRAEPREFD